MYNMGMFSPGLRTHSVITDPPPGTPEAPWLVVFWTVVEGKLAPPPVATSTITESPKMEGCCVWEEKKVK
jgi:hypothetical protein